MLTVTVSDSRVPRCAWATKVKLCSSTSQHPANNTNDLPSNVINTSVISTSVGVSTFREVVQNPHGLCTLPPYRTKKLECPSMCPLRSKPALMQRLHRRLLGKRLLT